MVTRRAIGGVFQVRCPSSSSTPCAHGAVDRNGQSGRDERNRSDEQERCREAPVFRQHPDQAGTQCAPRTEGGGIQYGQPPARVRSHHESHHVRNDELPRGPVDTRRDAVDDDRVFHIRRAASTNVSAPRPSGPLRPKRSPNIAASRLPPPVATSATDTSKTPRTASRDRHCVSKYSGRELSEDAAAKNGTKRGTRRH